MREILFRGKGKNGSWIYGIPTFELNFIFNSEQFNNPDNYGIIPDTLGQFTGFIYELNKYIFEGDLVKQDKEPIGKVEFYLGMFVIIPIGKFNEPHLRRLNGNAKVAGNIHD